MYLQALASAVPSHSYSQKECWDIFCQSKAASSVRERSRSILEKVLTGDSGIRKRHFVTDDVAGLFDRDAQTLNSDFETHAPDLATRALMPALDQSGLKSTDLDALLVCTCTGYLCPGLSSYISERIGMRRNAYLQDLVGLGCGAAIPTLRSASHITRSDKELRIAVVAVEVCSAAFYLDNDPGVLISLCLFGDGASASIWNGKPGPSGYRATDFNTLHIPEERELLRFVNRGGKLRNKLHKTVPQKAAQAVEKLYREQPDRPHILSHAGGRDVLDAIEEQMPGQYLLEARSVLEQFGNMSSPSVLFAMDEHLKGHSQDTLWLTAFGAGFAAHSMRLERR